MDFGDGSPQVYNTTGIFSHQYGITPSSVQMMRSITTNFTVKYGVMKSNGEQALPTEVLSNINI